MRLIDIGLNLTSGAFRRDEAEVLARAQAAGVAHMIVTGTDPEHSRQALALTRRYPGVLSATAGVHPHHASDFHATTLDVLRDLAAEPEVVAVGETGLDFNRNYSPPAAQIIAFEAQLELAAELGMPVFLHERDAHAELLERLRPRRDRLPAAVLHCFTGDAAQLRRYLDLDLHIGITGWICDERRGRHLRELVREIPLERLMIETDAPYLLPRDLPEKPPDRRNEPAFLPHILATVAGCRGCAPEALAEALERTTRGFFSLPPGTG